MIGYQAGGDSWGFPIVPDPVRGSLGRGAGGRRGIYPRYPLDRSHNQIPYRSLNRSKQIPTSRKPCACRPERGLGWMLEGKRWMLEGKRWTLEGKKWMLQGRKVDAGGHEELLLIHVHNSGLKFVGNSYIYEK